MPQIILDVQDLRTEFHLRERTVYAVNCVSFQLHEGEVLGIVGESGSGKTVTALSLMRLVETPGKIVAGSAIFHDQDRSVDLLQLTLRDLESIRGNKISMIFQDPMTSLNPVLTIGYQLTESLIIHKGLNRREAEAEAIRLLSKVGIPEAEVRIKDYPHQFSGGMRQRVMIAMAASCKPRLLIADEPTTALDVTIQAQIIDLINQLKDETGTSVIIITHDLGVIAEIATHVAVMYAGNIVEYADVNTIYQEPLHPYTRALMESIPRLSGWPRRLNTIEGTPPALTERIVGCPFAPRCACRVERCDLENPPLEETRTGHKCACWVAAPPREAESHV